MIQPHFDFIAFKTVGNALFAAWLQEASCDQSKLSSTAAYDHLSNAFRAKRTWPPDFEKLDHRYQFRLERKYRRRAKLKYARPTWTKITKLAQWGSVLGVLVYGVLFMDMGSNGSPFDGIRAWYKRTTDSLWTPRGDATVTNSASPVRPES